MISQKLLAKGRTSEIYELPGNRILKLYLEFIPQEWIANEAHASQIAVGAGLPVPNCYGLTEIDGRQGLIFERLVGHTMLTSMQKNPWQIIPLAKALGELHRQIHQVQAPLSLTQQFSWMTEQSLPEIKYLPDGLAERMMPLVEELAIGERLCHADFHPGNVMLTSDGPMIIDWMRAVRGDPLSDVARTSVMFLTAQLFTLPVLNWIANQSTRLMHNSYLKSYFTGKTYNQRQYKVWCAMMATELLGDMGKPQERAGCIKLIDRLVTELGF